MAGRHEFKPAAVPPAKRHQWKAGDSFEDASGGGWGGTVHAVEGNTAIVSYSGDTIDKFKRVSLDSIKMRERR